MIFSTTQVNYICCNYQHVNFVCYLFSRWTLTWVVGLFIDRVRLMISVVCNDVAADVAYDDVIAEGGDGDIIR